MPVADAHLHYKWNQAEVTAEHDVTMLIDTEFSRAEPTLSICEAKPKNRIVLAHGGAALPPVEGRRVLEIACRVGTARGLDHGDPNTFGVAGPQGLHPEHRLDGLPTCDRRVDRCSRQREDASRLREGNAPAIMTAIRQLCMNLFERDASSLRMSQKRRKTAWNDNYRAKVVFRSRLIRGRPAPSCPVTSRPSAQWAETSLSPTIPATMSPTKNQRASVAGSAKK